MAVRFNRNFNINRVVKKVVFTILALYVGGTIMDTFGTVMNGTTSAFYKGLTLIGWKLGGSGGTTGCAGTSNTNTICDTTSSAGVLAVVGIIGLASVVMEFVSWT